MNLFLLHVVVDASSGKKSTQYIGAAILGEMYLTQNGERPFCLHNHCNEFQLSESLLCLETSPAALPELLLKNMPDPE